MGIKIKTHCGYSGLYFYGGDEGDRTPGLGIANAALSRLSYIPEQKLFDIRFFMSGQFKKPCFIPFSIIGGKNF
jgi:hypothetical protein